MRRFLLTICLVAVTAATVPATASAVSKSAAKRAVQAEVRWQYPDGFDKPDVYGCRRNGSQWRCRWRTLTRDDASEGDTNGHYGLAYVYSRYDVSLVLQGT